jgi:hypothetical protein
MRRLLLIAFVLVLGATMALAQELPGGRVGIFGSNGGDVEDCAITDSAPGLLTVYVLHVGATGGVTACQYIAAKPECMTATYLSDTNPFPVTIGNSQIGVSIGYGTCRSNVVVVQQISYFASGTTPACCVYPIKCDPYGVDACTSGLIDIVDCNFDAALAKGQSGVVNPTGACACVDIVPTEESSWGRVKALYGE